MRTAIYGIGPAVVRHLASLPLPPNVILEDLDTPSLDLPTYLAGFDTVIFIDAVALDAPPGTIRIFTRDEITSAPTGIRVSPTNPPSTTPSSSSTSPGFARFRRFLD